MVFLISQIFIMRIYPFYLFLKILAVLNSISIFFHFISSQTQAAVSRVKDLLQENKEYVSFYNNMIQLLT